MAVYYIVDLATFATLFEFACEASEKNSLKVQWTKYAIESGANVSDFGYVDPEEIEEEGYLTSYPLIGGYSLQLVTTPWEALKKLVKLKQPVTVVGHYNALTVVLDEVELVSDGSQGEDPKVRIKGHPVEIPGVAYTTIPASRLKQAVKRRAAPKKSTGSGAKGGSWVGSKVPVAENYAGQAAGSTASSGTAAGAAGGASWAAPVGR